MEQNMILGIDVKTSVGLVWTFFDTIQVSMMRILQFLKPVGPGVFDDIFCIRYN